MAEWRQAAARCSTTHTHSVLRRRGTDARHHHLIHGQCACFVGAHDGNGAECLHSRQLADDGTVLRHLAHTNGKRDGNHRWQALRDDGHGNTHGDRERLLHRRVTTLPRDEKCDKGDDNGQDRQDAAKDFQLMLQRRLRIGCILKHGLNGTKRRGGTNGHDHGRALQGAP